MVISKAQYIISNTDWKKCPNPEMPEYAFIGRSNVGKSSLINMLSNHSNLAKISSNPGKTRTINHFLINENWYLVDLPGYGFARASHKERMKWEKMIQDYLCNRPNLISVFLLIDSRLVPQKVDLNFMIQLGEWEIPFVLLFTKADKIKARITQIHISNFLNQLKKNWEELPDYFITSTISKIGRIAVLDYISKCNTKFTAQ